MGRQHRRNGEHLGAPLRSCPAFALRRRPHGYVFKGTYYNSRDWKYGLCAAAQRRRQSRLSWFASAAGLLCQAQQILYLPERASCEKFDVVVEGLTTISA